MNAHTHFDDRDANDVECPACDEAEDQAGGREGPDFSVVEIEDIGVPAPLRQAHLGDPTSEFGGGHDDYDHLRESADQARADAVRDRQIELGLGPDLFR